MLKMRKYINILSSLKNDNSGNVFIMVGLSILTIFAIGGAGVDFGRAQLVKMKAQQASDQAALAAANPALASPTAADRKDSANMYYNLNFPQKYLGVKRPDIIPETDNMLNVSIANKANVGTNFIQTVGQKKLDASYATKVDIETKDPRYDVIMVLDISDSMDWKFDGTMCASGGVTPCNNNDGTSFPVGTPYCYTCSGATTDTCNYSSCGSSSRLTALKNAAKALNNILLADAVMANNRIAAVTWNSQFRSIQNFTNSRSTVESFIDSMSARYSTNSTTGLQKAKTMADSGFQPGHVHALVLLTDGENNGGGGGHDQTIDDSSVAICNTLKAMDPATIIYTIAVGNAMTKDSDGKYIKPEGANIDKFLRNCASGDPAQNGGEAGTQYYFIAPSSAELNNIFTTIATSLQRLRVTD